MEFIEYNKMFDRVFSHYLDAIDDADTAIFVVKEFVGKMSIDQMRLECEHLDKQDEGEA